MLLMMNVKNSGAKYPLIVGDMPFGSYVYVFHSFFIIRKNQLVNAFIIAFV